MASEDVIKSLWEIANANSEEDIDLDEFKKELNGSIDEKIKAVSKNIDLSSLPKERERALLIILSQAEANPNSFGQVQGKRFTISEGVIAKAVKTVKYENRFIQGTQEYEERIAGENTLDTKDVVLTSAVIGQMLSNFDSLSYEDRGLLWDNYNNLSDDEKEKLTQKTIDSGKNTIEESEKKGNIPTKLKREVEFCEALNKLTKEGITEENLNQLREKYKDVIDLNPELKEMLENEAIVSNKENQNDALQLAGKNVNEETKRVNDLTKAKELLEDAKTEEAKDIIRLYADDKVKDMLDDMNSKACLDLIQQWISGGNSRLVEEKGKGKSGVNQNLNSLNYEDMYEMFSGSNDLGNEEVNGDIDSKIDYQEANHQLSREGNSNSSHKKENLEVNSQASTLNFEEMSEMFSDSDNSEKDEQRLLPLI